MTLSSPVPRYVESATIEAAARLPRAIAFRLDALPVSIVQDRLTIALVDPHDTSVLDELRVATRLKIHAVTMARELIRERLRLTYGVDNTNASPDRRDIETPAAQAIDRMFALAVGAHASDIHIEPQSSRGRVRLRIDGILHETGEIAADIFGAFLSRLKLHAGMDIADKRQPQDGRYTVTVDRREIDARLSTIPTIDGEKIVVRLLDRHSQAPLLETLGMPASMLARMRALVHAPWGFIVVTGPTGSGKTMTLYASLAELDATSSNICSVEDPIEMRVRGVTQVQVNTRAGITFPSALRAFMRQDPNVIMVGEMRDAETASVGISAALAGQLVFTTLHANDAPRTIERLVELGVARHSLAAGITAVIAQRLVRRLCEHCRTPAAIPADIRARLRAAQTQCYVAGACGACAHTGYVGRTGVFELLEIDDDIRDAIAEGASSSHIARLGLGVAYRPMLDEGIAKVLAGETSFAELSRVVAWSAS